MFKIGLDVRVLDNQNHTGIERYAYNIAKELIKYETEEYCLVGEYEDVVFSSASRIKVDLPHSDTAGANKILALMGYMEGIDLLYSPYYPIPERRSFRGVLLIHDVIPLRHPEFFTNADAAIKFFKEDIKKAAINADHVLAVSEATKRDIMEFYSIDESKISVVPSAPPENLYLKVDHTSSQREIVLKKYNIDKPYILSVCTIEPRKNLSRVLKAFEIFRERYKEDVCLVLVGGLGWKYDTLLKEISQNPYKEDIILTGFVPDEDLRIIYKNAEVFVYASVYEGFGLPVLEAMCLEAPTVTSNCSSMPEVAGDAASYCDPFNPDSITDAIARIVFHPRTRDELVQKGLARAKMFTWKNNARLTREVLLNCLQK